MKGIKSYTRVWRVDKVLYAVQDLKLPVPMTFTQIAWFGASFFVMLFLGKLPLLSSLPVFIRYLGIPIVVTLLMSKKTFDGKKPIGFLKSVIGYFLRPKVTYAGKPIELKKVTVENTFTGVRSELYVSEFEKEE